jgi:transcriptional repressor NrdR
MVIKKDQSRELFDRDKIKRGMMIAIQKRPIAEDQIEKMIDEIEAKIRNTDQNEIESKRVGDLVARELKKIDKVAYIRFASVFREFNEVELADEANKLVKK